MLSKSSEILEKIKELDTLIGKVDEKERLINDIKLLTFAVQI